LQAGVLLPRPAAPPVARLAEEGRASRYAVGCRVPCGRG